MTNRTQIDGEPSVLKKQVAIITGASSGIGASLARFLAEEGMDLVIAARREEELNALARELTATGVQCVPVRCDVTVRAQAERLIHDTAGRFGRIDVLINNAGRGHFADIEDTTDEMIHNMFALNVYSLWHTTRPVLSYMKARASGHIINIASMAGKLGYPYNSAYVAAKHACVGFTQALRLELIETGIHATVVCPGGVLTDWASVTEGGPMLPFFSESGPLIKSIAAERGISLPHIEGVQKPETVARKIIECIRHPVPELYTHKGAKEFVLLATQNPERAEQQQLPVVLGERAAYRKLKQREHPPSS